MPCLEIVAVGFQQVLGHGLDTAGAVNLQWNAPSEHPGRKNQIRVADRVIGMQVRHEGHAQLDGVQRRDALVDDCRLCPAHDPAPKSTRYAVSLTTTAVDGPERSGSAGGFPVPRRTSCVQLDAGGAGRRWAAGLVVKSAIEMATTNSGPE